MNFSQEQNILVLFGGRCDVQTKSSKNQLVLNDIWIFSV